MFDIATTQSVVPRELDAIIDRSSDLTDEDWDRTIEWLPGWRVTELLDHVGRAAHQQAEAFENLFAGSSEIPTYPHPGTASRGEIAEALRSGRDRFVTAVDKLDDSFLDSFTPLPFGLVPTPIAVQIAALEYGYHHWDLEHALGSDAYRLPDDVSSNGFEFLGGLLPMLAGAVAGPAEPLAFELRSPAGALVLEHGGERWEALPAPTQDQVCVIEGDVDQLALAGMGRIPADHPTLEVSGPAAGEASRFKGYFPGP